MIDPTSMHMFTISDTSGAWPQPRNDKDGCWPCRFRKKGCKPGSSGPEGPCKDCETFNIFCCGQRVDRPSGPDVAETIRTFMKDWIANRANRGPGVHPFDLTRFIPPLPSSPVAKSSTKHQYQPADDIPNLSLFSSAKAHNLHQGTPAVTHAPSYNHTATICLLDTPDPGAQWTQYGSHNDNDMHGQPQPPAASTIPSNEDQYASYISSPSSYYDDNALSHSAELYDPFGTLEASLLWIYVDS
ncbi:hypothetical protein BS47DRAFT_1368461 [Hydnum rufescens UP504]|uniref:Zn(2)-C6 fungal-type domain-containing protein n=1 Tax=Hydnum rufescens UP504 TaxID=1448309 RepID=A0A9P6AFE3_9AGAM|nr:hypothetical protein BS47DRAFT_1368461 [Hydnum rufescens UP504]